MNTIKIASDIASENKKQGKLNTLTLSTGVELRLKPVQSYVYVEFEKRHKRPKPPVVFIEEHGREQENPDDPAYRDKLIDWEREHTMGLLDVALVLGTELISKPESIPDVDSDEWIDGLEIALGEDLTFKNKKERYLYWLKYVGASDEDLQPIMSGIAAFSGVLEEDVKDASNFSE